LGIQASNLIWDYEGIYGIGDISGNSYLKTLTLDYDFFDNEYFELNVINDGLIELYHPVSGSYYEFAGRGYIQYKSVGGNSKTKDTKEEKLRKQRTEKKDNPRENTRN
jgi:hypothetical protein